MKVSGAIEFGERVSAREGDWIQKFVHARVKSIFGREWAETEAHIEYRMTFIRRAFSYEIMDVRCTTLLSVDGQERWVLFGNGGTAMEAVACAFQRQKELARMVQRNQQSDVQPILEPDAHEAPSKAA